jgi:hypothetical protein
LLPTIAVERFAVTPLWNLVFRFQGAASAPLEALIFGRSYLSSPCFCNGAG